MSDFILNGLYFGGRSAFWILANLLIIALVAWAYYGIRYRIVLRQKRLAAERATWRDTVTKQTKPPPMVPLNPKPLARDFYTSAGIKADPDLPARLAFAKSPEGRDKARQSIAAERVRRVTKRRK